MNQPVFLLPRPARLLPLFLAVCLAACLSACGGGDPSTSAAEPPLAGARIGGPFRLVDGAGRTVADADFAGRWRIVYFGYTYCPDVCPTDLANIGAGLRAFERAAPDRAEKVVPLFITVDPARDTPAVVGRYVAAFHPRMVGLTGTPRQIADVAKSYAIFYARRDVPGASEYLMDHSQQTYLMDPDGRPVALVPSDEGADAVARVLERWVR